MVWRAVRKLAGGLLDWRVRRAVWRGVPVGAAGVASGTEKVDPGVAEADGADAAGGVVVSVDSTATGFPMQWMTLSGSILYS